MCFILKFRLSHHDVIFTCLFISYFLPSIRSSLLARPFSLFSFFLSLLFSSPSSLLPSLHSSLTAASLLFFLYLFLPLPLYLLRPFFPPFSFRSWGFSHRNRVKHFDWRRFNRSKSQFTWGGVNVADGLQIVILFLDYAVTGTFTAHILFSSLLFLRIWCPAVFLFHSGHVWSVFFKCTCTLAVLRVSSCW